MMYTCHLFPTFSLKAAQGTGSHSRSVLSTSRLVAMLRAKCCVWALLVLQASSSLPIRKCCPEHQQKSRNLNECVDLDGFRGVTPDFPWWLDPASLSPGAQNASSHVEFGVDHPCDFHMVAVLATARGVARLLPNGSLVYRGVTFSPGAYCADRIERNPPVHAFFLCPCAETTCVKKCCKENKTLVFQEKRLMVGSSCEPVRQGFSWTPQFHDANVTRLDSAEHVVFYNHVVCRDGRYTVPVTSGFWIFSNGSVLVREYGGNIPYGPEQYCADSGAEGAENLLVCTKTKQHQAPTARAKFYGVLFIIGVVFLLATLATFSLVPEIRKRNFNTVVCHVVSLLCAYVAVAAGQLLSVVPHAVCIGLAFVIQFSFLAAFFWLNVMCIDISWAFSGFRPPQGSATERDRKKFLYYSLYAWGSPTVITIVTAVMEYVVSIPDTYIKPDFGVKACWFKEKSATLAYFYGPMAALLLANFALFVYTSVKIILVQRATRILHSDESGRHDGGSFNKDKKRLMLYGKLFCLMGLTWITEIISWAKTEGNMKYFWYVTDGINLLRAVFIFIIFCCKPKVFRLLKQRLHSWGLFPSYNPSLENGRSTGTRKSSSSTQQSSLHSLQMTQLGNGGSSHP